MDFSRFAPVAPRRRHLSDAFLVQIQESAVSLPSVYFNLPRLAFAPVLVGAQDAPALLAIHNGGEAPLTISALLIAGTNSGDFSVIGGSACAGQTIAVGGECGMEVGFVPSMIGNETAVLSLTDNAPGNPQIMELVGTGLGPLAVVSPLTVNFGSEPVGATTAGQLITVTNAGNQMLTIQGGHRIGK